VNAPQSSGRAAVSDSPAFAALVEATAADKLSASQRTTILALLHDVSTSDPTLETFRWTLAGLDEQQEAR
jgi:hypothetical protein